MCMAKTAHLILGGGGGGGGSLPAPPYDSRLRGVVLDLHQRTNRITACRVFQCVFKGDWSIIPGLLALLRVFFSS